MIETINTFINEIAEIRENLNTFDNDILPTYRRSNHDSEILHDVNEQLKFLVESVRYSLDRMDSVVVENKETK